MGSTGRWLLSDAAPRVRSVHWLDPPGEPADLVVVSASRWASDPPRGGLILVDHSRRLDPADESFESENVWAVHRRAPDFVPMLDLLARWLAHDPSVAVFQGTSERVVLRRYVAAAPVLQCCVVPRFGGRMRSEYVRQTSYRRLVAFLNAEDAQYTYVTLEQTYQTAIGSDVVEANLRRAGGELAKAGFLVPVPSQGRKVVLALARGDDGCGLVSRPRREDTHIPVPPFVGRRSEVATLSSALREHRWVCVEGLPGVGKSRLVHEVIGALGMQARILELADPEFDGGVDENVLLRTLGVAREPGDAMVQLQSAIDGQGIDVLVFDSCERSLTSVYAFVARLLGSGRSRVRIVTTSVRSEDGPQHVIELSGLPRQDAGALLGSVRSADDAPTSSDERLTYMDEALGGNPAAIIWYALSIRDDSDVDSPTPEWLRHPTLEVLAQRTLESLDEPVRHALEQLRWFRAPFSWSDGSTLVASEPALRALVDARMLERTPETPARLRLSPLLRTALDARQGNVAGKDRFVEWAVRRATRLLGGLSRMSSAQLERRFPFVPEHMLIALSELAADDAPARALLVGRAVFETAMQRRDLATCHAAIRGLEGLAARMTVEQRLEYDLMRAQVKHRWEDVAHRTAHIQEVAQRASAAGTSGDIALRVLDYASRWFAFSDQSDRDTAQALIDQYEQRARTDEDLEHLAAARTYRAAAFFEYGDDRRPLLQEAVELADRSGSLYRQLIAAKALAFEVYKLDWAPRAEAVFGRALELCEAIDNPLMEVQLRCNVGDHLSRNGRPDAVEVMLRAIQIGRAAGLGKWLAIAHRFTALVHIRRGAMDEAEEELEASETMDWLHQRKPGLHVAGFRALIAMARRDWDGAAAGLRDAADAFEQAEMPGQHHIFEGYLAAVQLVVRPDAARQTALCAARYFDRPHMFWNAVCPLAIAAVAAPSARDGLAEVRALRTQMNRCVDSDRVSARVLVALAWRLLLRRCMDEGDDGLRAELEHAEQEVEAQRRAGWRSEHAPPLWELSREATLVGPA